MPGLVQENHALLVSKACSSLFFDGTCPCSLWQGAVPDSAFAHRSVTASPSKPGSDVPNLAPKSSEDSSRPSSRPSPNGRDENLDPPSINPAITETELVAAALAKANAIRLENGSSELELDLKLSLAAQRHAEEMHSRGFFDHKGVGGSLPNDRVKAAGAAYLYVGENIAKKLPDFHDIDELFKIWIESPPHKNSLLEKQYTKHGMGYKGGYWVHVFAN
jgi:uncharacterized protein YkwD